MKSKNLLNNKKSISNYLLKNFLFFDIEKKKNIKNDIYIKNKIIENLGENYQFY